MSFNYFSVCSNIERPGIRTTVFFSLFITNVFRIFEEIYCFNKFSFALIHSSFCAENLIPIRDAIEHSTHPDGSPRAKCALYPDNYRDGLYYLEVFSPLASKGGVTRKLRELTGAKTIVSFGDNGNDLPMFAESDYAFAVDRAIDRVKSSADGVVPSGMGVLEFIKNHIK